MKTRTNKPAPAPPDAQFATEPPATPGAAPRPLERLARPAGAVALILVSLFLTWQAFLLRAQQQAGEEILRGLELAVPVLLEPVRAEEARFKSVIAEAPFIERLRPGDDAARAAAAQYLRSTMRDAANVAVYAPDTRVLVEDVVRRLGYVRAAQLARAQSAGRSSIDALRDEQGRQFLSVLAPVRDGDALLAYAAVDVPLAPVAAAFDSVNLPAGRYDLRVGDDERAAVVISRGAGGDNTVDASRRVGSYNLWLTGTTPTERAWLPGRTSPAPLWILSLLALGGAAMLGGGRRVGALQQRIHEARSRRRGDDGPAFGELLDAQPKAPRSLAVTHGGDVAPVQDVAIDRSIFRAYDIRGVVGASLDAAVARMLGQAIGSAAQERGQHDIVVGRDGRVSGPELAAALIEGLRASGMNVIDIGLAPTPVVYFACYQLNTGSGVAVTGSHNPPNYNGFKIVLGGETLAEDAIQDLYERIVEGRLSQGSGTLATLDVGKDYIERIASDVQTERPFKVVIDCGNGVAGLLAPAVLEAIGCEVEPLYTEVDGTFPNHHPDPSDPANLEDLILAVRHTGADLGLAFDGDGDRLGVVTAEGEIIYPDRVLMLFAIDVLVRDPGATIIYDVKCTGHLQSVVLRHGGSPLMWKTGHSLIKAKMRETNAALAGEMSGHFFFRERWYGFDDGIYAAARLLEILASDLEGATPSEIFARLPCGASTPELKIATSEGEHYRFIERFRKAATFDGARITLIDGVRADWTDGWGLVRASNTTPSLVLRFDADDEAALGRIQNAFRSQILAVAPELELPF